MTIIVEIFLASIVTIVFGSLEWQIHRGNRLAVQANAILEDLRLQQNANLEILRGQVVGLLNRMEENLSQTGNNQEALRNSLIKANILLEDLREVNIQLLTGLTLLERKVGDGNGQTD